MRKVLALVALFISSSYSFAATELTKPEELATCLQNYIQQRIVAPETASWEHLPKYEFAGKYLHASWHSYPMLEYGIMYASVGPKNDVYCDYPTDSNGVP